MGEVQNKKKSEKRFVQLLSWPRTTMSPRDAAPGETCTESGAAIAGKETRPHERRLSAKVALWLGGVPPAWGYGIERELVLRKKEMPEDPKSSRT